MLPLLFTIALDSAPLAAPPDGTYTYTETAQGRPAGTTSVVVKRDGTSFGATEVGKLSAMGQSISAQTSLSLGANLTPASYAATYTVGPRVVHARIAFSGNTATETSDNGGKTYELTAETKSFAVLDGGFMSGTLFVPAQVLAQRSAPVFGVIPSFGFGFPLALDTVMKPDRPAGVPPLDASMTFSGHTVVTIWYDPKTLIVDEVDVPAANSTVVRVK